MRAWLTNGFMNRHLNIKSNNPQFTNLKISPKVLIIIKCRPTGVWFKHIKAGRIRVARKSRSVRRLNSSLSQHIPVVNIGRKKNMPFDISHPVAHVSQALHRILPYKSIELALKDSPLHIHTHTHATKERRSKQAGLYLGQEFSNQVFGGKPACVCQPLGYLAHAK